MNQINDINDKEIVQKKGYTLSMNKTRFKELVNLLEKKVDDAKNRDEIIDGIKHIFKFDTTRYRVRRCHVKTIKNENRDQSKLFLLVYAVYCIIINIQHLLICFYFFLFLSSFSSILKISFLILGYNLALYSDHNS